MRIEIDHHQIALALRWLHVAAMAAILGGGLLVSWLAVGDPDERFVVRVAARYEQVFWGGIGILVMTGVGNLGAFDLALPSPATSWGGIFMAKLWSVGALVALSLPRSLAVARIVMAGGSAGALRWLYPTTTVLIASIAALAVWLAHG